MIEDFTRGSSHPVEIRKSLLGEVILEMSFEGSDFQMQRCRRGDPCREKLEQWPES